jgi:hypothetical protein
MLDRLESGSPQSVSNCLDWAVRYSLFDHFIRVQGFDWLDLEKWNLVLEQAKLIVDRKNAMEGRNPAAWTIEKAFDQMVPEFALLCRHRDVTADGYRRFLSLRAQLFELDTRCGQLGEQGLMTQLDRAGVLNHHYPGVDNFEHAMEHPPQIGRAHLRGNCVRRLGTSPERSAYACDWSAIWNKTQRRLLDLSDPFNQHENWTNKLPQIEDPLASARLARNRALLERLRRGLPG